MSQGRIFGEREKEAARRRYAVLVEAVARAIDEADPKSLLQLGCPADEYSAEVGTITPRVAKAATLTEVRDILHEEFENWFGVGEVGPLVAYEIPAKAIWEAVLAFRQAV